MNEQDKKKKEIEEAKTIAEQNREIIRKLVAEGKLPEPRPLTRKERKELDKAGYNVFKIKQQDSRSISEIREDCADWILEKLYPDFDFDLPNPICLWFGSYIFAISYKDDLSEKN